MVRTLAERFWSKVDKRGPDDCWLWIGTLDARGYGRFCVNKKQALAHRVAFSLTHDRWPTPCGLHHCDTPACVNPAHIFEGTDRDNNADMMAKGRNRQPRGEGAGMAKLTARDVQIIRVLVGIGCSRAEIGRRYGVTDRNIHAIDRRITWRHVPDYDFTTLHS